MANYPYLRGINISQVNPSTGYPRLKGINFASIAPPQLQAIHFVTTPLAPNYPQVQSVKFAAIGPTYWLNGQAVGDLFVPGSGSIVQNDSVFTWFID